MQEITNGYGVGRAAPRPDTFSTRLIIAADRGIYQFAGRWQFGFNAVLLVWAAAVLAAPLLITAGAPGVADPIYGFFGLFCHQDEARSFHIFGEKLACCERCAAIYFSIALAGMLFASARNQIRQPCYSELMLLISPVVLDGMAVGSGFYSGHAVMRVLTGTLFGVAVIWLLYPRFETGFATMRMRLETLFEKLVAQGRARPLA